MLEKSSTRVPVPDCLSPVENSEFLQHWLTLVAAITVGFLIGKPFISQGFSISSYPNQISIDLPASASLSTHLACLGDSAAGVVSGLDRNVRGQMHGHVIS